MIPSTKQQRQLIGIACGQLGIDKEMKAEMLMERYGKEHTTEIGKAEAAEFLKELVLKGFVITQRAEGRGRGRFYRPERAKGKRQRTPMDGGKTVAMVSPAEIEKIEALAGLIEWKYKNGLYLWMKARIGIERIRTAGDAYRVIEGLKKMFENGMKKEFGEGWWVMEHVDPGVRRYVLEHCPVEYRQNIGHHGTHGIHGKEID